MVENIHATLVAFFRTSDEGEWMPDDTAVSDAFCLNFRRGLWSKQFFGQSLSPQPLTGNKDDAPMQLRLLIRPSPVEMRISVEHKVFSRRRMNAAQQNLYGFHIAKELVSLSAYLRQVYELPALPLVRNE